MVIVSFPYRLQKFPLFLSSSYRLQKFADTDRLRVNRRPIRKDFFPDRYDFVPIVFTSSSCKRGLRCTFLARRSAKLIANFSATMVTSLPSFSLSLSLSLSVSLSLSHRMYLTHNIGSASALPIIWFEDMGSITKVMSLKVKKCHLKVLSFLFFGMVE